MNSARRGASCSGIGGLGLVTVFMYSSVISNLDLTGALFVRMSISSVRTVFPPLFYDSVRPEPFDCAQDRLRVHEVEG